MTARSRLPVSSQERHTDLIAKLEGGERSNKLDVLIEVALFKPDETHVDAVPNSAGTKVIYANRDGSLQTHWAPDWSLRPEAAIALLKSLEAAPQTSADDALGRREGQLRDELNPLIRGEA